MEELNLGAPDVRVGKAGKDHPVHEVRQRRGSVDENPGTGKIFGRDKNADDLELATNPFAETSFLCLYQKHSVAI